MSSTDTRIAFLASGSGSTVAAVLDAIKAGTLTGLTPALLLTNRPEAGVIEKARAYGLPDTAIAIVSKKDCGSQEAFGEALLAKLREANVDLIAQLGWLPLTPPSVIQAYPNQIINQHPAALDPPEHPDFGGKGMYGKAAIAAALYFHQATDQCPFIEATTHLVTEQFDRGLLLRTQALSIQPNDTVTSLQTRLLPVEHENVIATLQACANKQTSPFERPQRLIKDQYQEALDKAKLQAIHDFPKG